MSRALLSLVLLSACRDAEVTGVERLEAPGEVDCGDTAIGVPKPCAVSILVTGTRSRDLDVRIDGPFTASPALALAPGEHTLELSFTPTTAGRHDGAITLADDEGLVTVRLAGTGLDACVAAAPCLVATFDRASLSCLEQPVPNGTSCAQSDLCLEQPTCVDGACAGAPRSCDDGDPCTVDACDRARGCTHHARTCPASSNPCEAAVCDRATGCGVAAVIDGTPCGPNDCREALVCLSGRCERRAAPEGSVCGPATTCHAEQRCVGDTCVPGSPSTPRERWRFRPAAGLTVQQLFPSVTGQVYAIVGGAERERPGPLTLVALETDGRVRFSSALPTDERELKRFFEDDEAGFVCLVMQGPLARGFSLSCRDRRTGVEQWRRAWADLAPSASRTEPVYVMQIASVRSGALQLVVLEGNTVHTLHHFAITEATGAIEWQRTQPGHSRRLVVSKRGETLLQAHACSGDQRRIDRVSADGLHRSAMPTDSAPVAMTETNALVMSNATLAVLGSTSRPLPLPPGASPWGTPLVQAGEVTTLMTGATVGLGRFSLDGGTRWVVPLDAGSPSLFSLLEDGSSTVMGLETDAGLILDRFSPDGQLHERCRFGSHRLVGIAAELGFALTDGAVVAFELPGVQAARSGWPAYDGFNHSKRFR